MEGNKDESEKCLRIAEKCIRAGEKDKAVKFLQKAEKLYPSQRAKELISRLTTSNGSAASGEEDRSGASSGSMPNGNMPGAAGTSGNEEEPQVRQRRGSGGREHAQTKEVNYTSEQLTAVKRVRKCRDYYEILGVSKDCLDEDLKKSYKKLALKFHPDKNHAPGATEAFKAIGNAFGVLNNPEKRRRYDQFGREDEITRSRHSHSGDYDYTRGFEGDISAEELFNMFFGGAFPTGSVYARRTRTHAFNMRHHHSDTQAEPAYTLLLQLAPILFLVLLSLLSSFLVSDPPYSLARTERYNYERKTQNLQVPYFVKADFNNDYRGSIRRLESQIEDDYISNLRGNCFRERSYKENMLWRARNFNDAKLYERAQGLKTPSCDTLQRIYS